MDANKLLELLQLLEADEQQFGVGTAIAEISTLIGQNNEESTTQAVAKAEALFEVLRFSRAAHFSGTELEVLKLLNAEEYFGMGLLRTLDEILSKSRGFQVASKLSTFRSERKSYYAKLLALKNALSDVGIEPYEQKEPEIALSIPDEFVKVDEVAGYLNEFGQFLRVVQDATADEKSPRKELKIKRLSRGTAEFFIGGDPAVAMSVLNVLSDLANIYLAARELRNRENKNGTALSKEEQKQVDKVYDEIARARMEGFIEDTPEQTFKKATPEQKIKIRKHLRALIKWLPLGIHVEVVFDKTIEPVAESSVKGKKIEDQKRLQANITEMYALPVAQLKLPESLEIKVAKPKTPRKKRAEGLSKKTDTSQNTEEGAN